MHHIPDLWRECTQPIPGSWCHQSPVRYIYLWRNSGISVHARRAHNSHCRYLEASLTSVGPHHFYSVKSGKQPTRPHWSFLTGSGRTINGSTWTKCIVRKWITSRKGTQSRVSTYRLNVISQWSTQLSTCRTQHQSIAKTQRIGPGSFYGL